MLPHAKKEFYVLGVGDSSHSRAALDMLPHKWGPLRKYSRTLPDILAPISGNFFAKGLHPTFYLS